MFSILESVPLGALVNAIAIIVGSSVGLIIGSKLPDRIRTTVFHCLALAVFVIGIQMSFQTKNAVILIFSLVLGGIIGEALDLETRFMNVGEKIKAKINSKNPNFTHGFVSATVLFCIGAMAIIGSFDEGLRGETSVAFSKSILDGFTSILLASVYGFGVFLSALCVFIYQGSLTLLAGVLEPYISENMMTELTAVGGAMIIGISFNLLEMTQIRLTNLLPSLLVCVLLVIFI